MIIIAYGVVRGGHPRSMLAWLVSDKIVHESRFYVFFSGGQPFVIFNMFKHAYMF